MSGVAAADGEKRRGGNAVAAHQQHGPRHAVLRLLVGSCGVDLAAGKPHAVQHLGKIGTAACRFRRFKGQPLIFGNPLRCKAAYDVETGGCCVQTLVAGIERHIHKAERLGQRAPPFAHAVPRLFAVRAFVAHKHEHARLVVGIRADRQIGFDNIRLGGLFG